MDDDVTWFSLSLSSRSQLFETEDTYLTSIEGNILYGDEDQLAGKLNIFYADLAGAAESGYSPFDILDIESATAPYFNALFDKETGEFKETIHSAAGNIFQENLLILDRLEILPEFRGKKLGLACIYRIIQQYRHGCGLIALKCFPLQFEAKHKHDVPDEWQKSIELEKFSKSRKTSWSKLEKYYSSLGFTKVRGTEIMIMNPDYKQPRFEDL